MHGSSYIKVVKPAPSEQAIPPVSVVTLPIPSSDCVSMNAMRPEQRSSLRYH